MISAGLVLIFFVIALVILGAVALGTLILAYRTVDKQDQALERSQEMVESLTKLAASKDIAAYQGLTVRDQAPFDVNPIPMDDQSVAVRMMEEYRERGIDPILALAPESAPLDEFGGIDAFLGRTE